MSATITFPLCPWKHDPSGQPMDYTCPLPIAASDTLTNVTVVAVDDNDVPLVGDTLAITNVAFALVAGIWMVTFWVTNGTAGKTYTLRCRWTLSDTRGSDKTVRLQCLNT